MNKLTWTRIKVSSDGTHHVIDGKPLYNKRFLGVMSFHEPGLAAVRDVDSACHINICGCPAYSNIFEKTFGFYENLAAVQNQKKSFHITPDGVAAYAKTYDWCGNFQGARAVVRIDDGYCHIFPDGQPIYQHRFLYAGDYREGRAVVRLHGGLCAHIDEVGDFAHTFRYRDLGVYHKGYACACDDRGWMHINKDGVPIYDGRFFSLEPFYNERALAETFNGEIIVIDEKGRSIDTIVNPVYRKNSDYVDDRNDYFHALSADMVGYWKTYVLAVAVKLFAPEKFPILGANASEILGIPKDNVQVFLCALAELDIIRKRGDMWELTAKGEFLRHDHPFSLAPAACIWSELAELGAGQWLHALIKKTRSDIFSKIASNSQKVQAMHEMLASYAKYNYSKLPDILPLKDIPKLIDAGGGNGMTARLIVNANKNITVVVFDRSEVLVGLKTADDDNSRIIFHNGDLCLPWNIDGNAVLLARVIHDWDDEKAMLILRNARDVLSLGDKIFIVELLPQSECEAGMCSFHLLTVGGGRERMLSEYQCMMGDARFQFLDLCALDNDIFVLIGEAI